MNPVITLIVAVSLMVGLDAGFVFGIGMVLAGGCVVGSLYKLGAGSVAGGVALLGESGLAGGSLQIELTENTLLHDIERCAQVLTRLREHGVRVAIDDFGTGYSSLTYLKQLPIDNLKIDRSFVRDIPDDPNDCAIAAAVIGLARTLGLEAVAEGIETRAQQDYLAQIGCKLVQGYLHARPLPARAFAAEVATLHAALADRASEAQTGREARPF